MLGIGGGGGMDGCGQPTENFKSDALLLEAFVARPRAWTLYVVLVVVMML